MIGIIFRYANEYIEVVIDNHAMFFRDSTGKVSTIEGLRLNYDGVIKEFPDLIDKEDWKKQAIKRFKMNIKKYKTEEEIVDYLVKDLGKCGYVLEAIQKKGHRVKKIR